MPMYQKNEISSLQNLQCIAAKIKGGGQHLTSKAKQTMNLDGKA